MRTVHKYPVEGFVGTLSMPEGAKIIHFGDDENGTTCIWAEVDTHAKMRDRPFRVFGTGHPIENDNAEHVGTKLEGGYVFHLYMTR